MWIARPLFNPQSAIRIPQFAIGLMEEVVLMRSWFKALLGAFTLGAAVTGCNTQPQAPPTPTDVVLNVPGMN